MVTIPSDAHMLIHVWSVAVTIHTGIYCAVQHQYYSYPSRTLESLLRLRFPLPIYCTDCVAARAHGPACALSLTMHAAHKQIVRTWRTSTVSQCSSRCMRTWTALNLRRPLLRQRVTADMRTPLVGSMDCAVM
jgi:hypothetical protein